MKHTHDTLTDAGEDLTRYMNLLDEFKWTEVRRKATTRNERRRLQTQTQISRTHNIYLSPVRYNQSSAAPSRAQASTVASGAAVAKPPRTRQVPEEAGLTAVKTGSRYDLLVNDSTCCLETGSEPWGGCEVGSTPKRRSVNVSGTQALHHQHQEHKPNERLLDVIDLLVCQFPRRRNVKLSCGAYTNVDDRCFADGCTRSCGSSEFCTQDDVSGTARTPTRRHATKITPPHDNHHHHDDQHDDHHDDDNDDYDYKLDDCKLPGSPGPINCCFDAVGNAGPVRLLAQTLTDGFDNENFNIC